MSWNNALKNPPELENLVVVFRDKNKKYTIASRQKLRDFDGSNESIEWVTQHGCVHEIHEKDLWIPFEHLHLTETKKYDK